jgi:hypothetical protein
MFGMGRAPDKAHSTAAIGTCRAVARAVVLTLQHDTSPRVKRREELHEKGPVPCQDPSLPVRATAERPGRSDAEAVTVGRETRMIERGSNRSNPRTGAVRGASEQFYTVTVWLKR